MADFPDFSLREPGALADSMFVERWSPRAFQKTAIDQDSLGRMMDAARWSPSCFNDQPWQIYTSSQSSFDDFLDCLVPANQDWAKEASVLGFMVVRQHFTHNGNLNDWAEFDCGAAWMSMSLQARLEGFYTHGMGGINADAAAKMLNLDDGLKVLMGFAIGKLVEADELNQAQLQAETPNQRKELSEVWFSV